MRLSLAKPNGKKRDATRATRLEKERRAAATEWLKTRAWAVQYIGPSRIARTKYALSNPTVTVPTLRFIAKPATWASYGTEEAPTLLYHVAWHYPHKKRGVGFGFFYPAPPRELGDLELLGFTGQLGQAKPNRSRAQRNPVLNWRLDWGPWPTTVGTSQYRFNVDYKKKLYWLFVDTSVTWSLHGSNSLHPVVRRFNPPQGNDIEAAQDWAETYIMGDLERLAVGAKKNGRPPTKTTAEVEVLLANRLLHWHKFRYQRTVEESSFLASTNICWEAITPTSEFYIIKDREEFHVFGSDNRHPADILPVVGPTLDAQLIAADRIATAQNGELWALAQLGRKPARRNTELKHLTWYVGPSGVGIEVPYWVSQERENSLYFIKRIQPGTRSLWDLYRYPTDGLSEAVRLVAHVSFEEAKELAEQDFARRHPLAALGDLGKSNGSVLARRNTKRRKERRAVEMAEAEAAEAKPNPPLTNAQAWAVLTHNRLLKWGAVRYSKSYGSYTHGTAHAEKILFEAGTPAATFRIMRAKDNTLHFFVDLTGKKMFPGASTSYTLHVAGRTFAEQVERADQMATELNGELWSLAQLGRENPKRSNLKRRTSRVDKAKAHVLWYDDTATDAVLIKQADGKVSAWGGILESFTDYTFLVTATRHNFRDDQPRHIHYGIVVREVTGKDPRYQVHHMPTRVIGELEALALLGGPK